MTGKIKCLYVVVLSKNPIQGSPVAWIRSCSWKYRQSFPILYRSSSGPNIWGILPDDAVITEVAVVDEVKLNRTLRPVAPIFWRVASSATDESSDGIFWGEAESLGLDS